MQKKTTILKQITAGALLCAFVHHANAGVGSVYTGVDVGNTSLSGDVFKSAGVFEKGQHFKDADKSYSFHVGYQLTSWFAAELAYNDFGSATDSFKLNPAIRFIVAPNDTQTIDAKGVSFSTVFSQAIVQDFSVFAVLGVSSMHYKSRMSGGFSPASGSFLDDDTLNKQGLMYGVGAKYAFNESINIRTDLRRNDVGYFTFDSTTIGLEFVF